MLPHLHTSQNNNHEEPFKASEMSAEGKVARPWHGFLKWSRDAAICFSSEAKSGNAVTSEHVSADCGRDRSPLLEPVALQREGEMSGSLRHGLDFECAKSWGI
jgi:hypothetical protein